MKSYELNAAIRREYPLNTLSWTTSEGIGTELDSYLFPEVLFNQPYLNDKLKDFRYFRGGVRLTFRVVANRFLYGKLLIAYTPTFNYNDAFDYSPSTNTEYVKYLSGYPHMLISASSSDVAIFDIPFVSNKRAIDMLSVAVGELAKVKVVVLNPLTSANEDIQTTNVFVTAQFLEPEVFLPNITPGFIIQSKSEALSKSKQGIISSALESTKMMASGIYNVASDPVYTEMFKRTYPHILMGLGMLGLSKPTSLQMTEVSKINPYSDIASGKGISTCIKLAMDPENCISTVPNVGGMSEDEMVLSHIIGTPQLKNIATVVNTTPKFSLVDAYPVGSDTYLDFIATAFLYSSGTTKFKLYITASIFHSVRLVFYLSTASAAITSNAWQNSYHRIVDIEGDTEVELAVPYVEPRIFSKITDVIDRPEIWCEVLAWSDPTELRELPIEINVYKAGASDYQFGAQREVRYNTGFTVQSCPREDFASSFEFLSDDMTYYGHKGLVCGEHFTTLREMIHRFHAYNSFDTNSQPVYSQSSLRGVEVFGWLYLYRRGSMRFKVLQSKPSINCVYIKDGSDELLGTTLSCEPNPVIDFEVPFYTDKLFLPLRVDIDPMNLLFSYKQDTPGINTSQFIMKAVGDDFSFHFLVPPPNGALVRDGSTTAGLPGLALFLTDN